MEWGHEEATQKSSRRGPGQVRRLGQRPQEENCCPAKRPTPAADEAPEEGMNAAIASIRARFGYRVIGLGYGGIRYLTSALR